jgi:DNA-binding transcriptional MerR regulator
VNLFSISDLARFSGVKAHTIRIWEKRYGALRPHRSYGNTRYYDGTQLRRLLNIVSLQDSRRLPEICAMTDREMFNLVENKLNKSNEPESHISQLLGAGMAFDEVRFDKILSHCMLHYGVHNTYRNVIFPLLQRLGIMWSADAVAPVHEHFISSLIIQKLRVAIDSVPPATDSKETWLLFLPENEFHEVGLLYANYMLRQAGKRTIYLGGNLPLESIKSGAKATAASHALFFFVCRNETSIMQDYISDLRKAIPGAQLLACGAEENLAALKSRAKVNFVYNWTGLEKLLKQS